MSRSASLVYATRARRGALVLFVMWAAIAAAALVLAWSNQNLFTIGPDKQVNSDVDMVFFAVMAAIGLVYALVGATIVVRTRHVVGWLLLVIAVGFTALFAAEQYVLHELVASPGSLPWPLAVSMTTQWLAASATTSITLILLLFPSGKPRTPRWRPLVAGVVPAAILWGISYMLTPDAVRGPWVDHDVLLYNPLAPAGLYKLLRFTFGVGVGASLLLSVAGVVCLVLRSRASRGAERQQIKWLSYVGVVIVLLFVSMMVAPESIGNYLWLPFFLTLMFGIPLSIGAAILRYRLYDIDRIVSRTVSYALVTGILLGSYVGLVVIFQRVLAPLTGSSDLAVAASTLIVAALFVPLRRRVQNVIDRRFNRARYDTVRTIEAFASRLREEIDIDALGAELRDVVSRTMEPGHVTVWLREGVRR